MSRNATVNDLSGWSTQIGLEASGAKNLTLGIANGNRDPMDRRVLDQIARSLTRGSSPTGLSGRMLVVRMRFDGDVATFNQQASQEEWLKPSASPLGNWALVDIVPDEEKSAANTANHFARHLPLWKQQFRLILVDLGPVQASLSRALGYFCDGFYLVLGPDTCGSPDWLRQQIVRHERAGSSLSGTITAGLTRAA